MEYIIVNEGNIDAEHICCAITEKKGENCVGSKKAWLRDRFQDGLVFLKANARGKVFIEYLPAEAAWAPITAPGYFYIDCFWVSGQFKGHGHGRALLEQAISDAKEKGKAGLCVLSSKKKQPFLSDPKILKHMGFLVADTAPPQYELLYYPLGKAAPVPAFRPQVKDGTIKEQGLVLYHTNQCPFTDKYVPLGVAIAEEMGRTITVHHIQSKEDAQSAPCPFTTYSLYHNGAFVTSEIFSEKKWRQYLESNPD
ncbi:GNAT family N-acetyltransferase [Eubacteriales bacterium OttesenSCG-928-M02]|nr:GNAT family N-acetyltransferase [Eubacteriales bacterium OttesenSCG-928-M02]